MSNAFDYRKLIPSVAVRTVMKPEKLDDISVSSLAVNIYRSWEECADILTAVAGSSDNVELQGQISDFLMLRENIVRRMTAHNTEPHVYILWAYPAGIRTCFGYYAQYNAALTDGKRLGLGFDIAVSRLLEYDDIDNRIDTTELDDISEFFGPEHNIGIMRYNEDGGLVHVIPGTGLNLSRDVRECALLYSYVDVFNPFERGDIVRRVNDYESIGVVLTSQRKWMAHKKKCLEIIKTRKNDNSDGIRKADSHVHSADESDGGDNTVLPDFYDTYICVDFVSETGEIRKKDVCPVELEFVQPDCELIQYDFLKSLHNLIKGNGDVGMVMGCYEEITK